MSAFASVAISNTVGGVLLLFEVLLVLCNWQNECHSCGVVERSDSPVAGTDSDSESQRVGSQICKCPLSETSLSAEMKPIEERKTGVELCC